MSPTPPSATAGVPPPTGPGTAASARPSPSPNRRDRSPIYMGIGIAVAVVAVLFVVLFVPPHTGSTLSGAAVLTYSGARPIADSAASGFEGGGWNLLFAVGVQTATAESLPVNATTLSSAGCTFSPAAGLANVTVPAYSGNRSSGATPGWEFSYSNSAGDIALVTVIDGHGTVVGTLSGGECFVAAFALATVPSDAVDSSAAMAAVAPQAQGYLAAHPNASAAFALFGQNPFGTHGSGAEWLIDYTTCSASGSGPATGADFNATVNAVTGQVTRTNSTPNAPCGSRTFSLAEPAPLGPGSHGTDPFVPARRVPAPD